jgi:tetratricopeptide (TPR) repeat protein
MTRYLALVLALGLVILLAVVLWTRLRRPSSLDELPVEAQMEFRSAEEAARHHIRHGEFDAAEGELRRCLEIFDGDAATYDILGHLCLARRLHGEGLTEAEEDALVSRALEHLDRAQGIDPTLFSPHLLRFQIFRKPDLRRYDPEAALREVEEVIRLDPENATVRQMLVGWLLSGTGSPSDVGLETASRHLRETARTVPPDSPGRFEVLGSQGIVHLCLGDLEAAAETFRGILAEGGLPPGMRPVVRRDLGYTLYRQGRYGEAAEQLLTSLKAARSLEAAWLLRLAYEGLGRDPGDLPEAYRFEWTQEEGDPTAPPGPWFTEVGESLGVARTGRAGASAFEDQDGDGDPDLLVVHIAGPPTLLRHEGGRFEDATGSAGLEGIDPGVSLSVVDYDNDGHLDVYVCRGGWHGPAPNTLLRSRGDGAFEDRTAAAGLGDGGSGSLSLWADFDRDGDLDVFIANGVLGDGSTCRLYGNLGDGTFEDRTEEAGLGESRRHQTLGAAVGDYDRDGDADIFINGRFETPNRLYRNRGDGIFEEVAEGAGVKRDGHNGHAVFFLDYDNDACPDILTTAVSRWSFALKGMSGAVVPRSDWEVQRDAPRLFRNRGDGSFTDVTLKAGVALPRGFAGGVVADIDNDGHLDLYLGMGDWDLQRLEPAVFYHNRGDGTFRDLSRLAGLAHLGKGAGGSVADLDGDGDLDIHVPRGGLYPGDAWPDLLYRNEGGTGNHWIHLRLVGTRSNRFAVGAQVTLTSGESIQYREVRSGDGVVAFGLGDRQGVDRIEILWPSGERQVLDSPPIDVRLEVTEGQEGWTIGKAPR